ncbi:hypothetical protein [Rhodococcus maanshanensis]|uniref:CorA-like Mg2+ transporter protein n=1 Tax=Rhodococcus maanshanensis TaxID=183556 RepID=A0A1H7VIZ2_9NOCA|nr:hypothetical protein [Rhodococcus maanshanensis]SEM08787.1 hypothetical protein SAMN05444583_12219 [Rhodococcus maanshanensis]
MTNQHIPASLRGLSTRDLEQCTTEELRAFLTGVCEYRAGLAQLHRKSVDLVKETRRQRVVSGWLAVGIVPIALGGIYASNFSDYGGMPETKLLYGWPLFVGALATLCGTLYLVMRRRGWMEA